MLAISLWIHNPHSGNRDNFLLTLTETIFKWTRIIIISGSTITRLALRSPRLLTLSSLHIKSIVCECRVSKWNINIDSCYALDSRTADHQSHGKMLTMRLVCLHHLEDLRRCRRRPRKQNNSAKSRKKSVRLCELYIFRQT